MHFSIALAILLGILYLVYLFLGRRFSRVLPGRNISIIERKYIDRNSSIVLVRLMDDYYFILVTQNGGTIIKKLDEVEASKVEVKSDFRSEFFRRLGRKR